MQRFTLDDITDLDRRSVLKSLGLSGVAAAGAGFGLLTLTSSAAAADVAITASNPDTTVSDDGEIESVYIEPTLTITWDGFDAVVGKVRILVEAATGAIDLDPGEVHSLEYMPVFVATGYANGTDNAVETETGPGTHGQFTLDWFSSEEEITVYDADGAPDYDTADYTCGATKESYLNGTLMGDPIESAKNGFYGAAGSTNLFEEETDGGSNVTTVYLRYTITLRAPDISFITEEGYDLDPEAVKPFSPLVMPGGDGGQSPDLTDREYGTVVGSDVAADYETLEPGELVEATAIPYDVVQASATHPAIMVDYAHFDVTVENQPAEAGVTGDTGAGVTVDETIGTLTPTNGTTGNESEG